MYLSTVVMRRILLSSNSERCLEHTFLVSFFHTNERLAGATDYRLKHSISESFSLLEVHAECTEDELKNAYLKKAKIYHPDGQTSNSDATKFVQVQEAYKIALEHKRDKAVLEEEAKKKVDIDNIKHTVPQHRRFLTFEGIGYGPPSRREQQYKQFRVAQAAESVYEHRVMKHGAAEDALVTKDKTEARKIKISNLIDRVVDDLIRESMQRGDFDNLPGRGKPLEHSDYNPFIDLTTHNINKILVNNGFKPEWIMLSKEIRDGITTAREKLAIVRARLGPPPYSDLDKKRWTHHTDKFRESVQEINVKINKFNFIVPFMEKQMVHYNIDSNIQKIVDNHKRFLPTDAEGQSRYMDSMSLPAVKHEDMKIHWQEVWSNIKMVFTLR